MTKSKFQNLRKKYPAFIYKAFSWETNKGKLKISFDFFVSPNIQFHPTVVIQNVTQQDIQRMGELALKNLVFHLGLMEIPSYWKATCSPEIIIEAGYLDKNQLQWWEDLILNGMGEFFYKNKINFTVPNFLNIRCARPGLAQPNRVFKGLFKNQTLIPIGGGKDAIVTLELLKKLPHRAFVLNPKQEHKEILKIALEKNPIVVERAIDPKLLELNRKGYLNGHTPFSAYLSFLSVFAGVLFDYKYIALSNERSSNEGNVKYLGKTINHQYSKSFDFEKKFRQYSKKYLAKNIGYFRFLRPLYELQIARIFSQYQKYFPIFLSCNEANKTKSGMQKPKRKWCGKCAKCLFVFISLYPFIGEKQTIKIFKKNLFEDRMLISLMEELTGQKKFKPFECVGTTKESVGAFYLCLKNGQPRLLLQHFQKHIAPKYPNLRKEAWSILSGWNEKNFLPSEFAKLLKQCL